MFRMAEQSMDTALVDAVQFVALQIATRSRTGKLIFVPSHLRFRIAIGHEAALMVLERDPPKIVSGQQPDQPRWMLSAVSAMWLVGIFGPFVCMLNADETLA